MQQMQPTWALGGRAAKLERATRDARQLGRALSLEEVMARWRVDYLGKKGSHLGPVEALYGAVEQAAKQFNITPARRNKIAVTRVEERKRGE
jgi:hypothetical protein